MSSEQLGLFLKCLFNPFSCLKAEFTSNILCWWSDMDFLVDTPIKHILRQIKCVKQYQKRYHCLLRESICVSHDMCYWALLPPKQLKRIIVFHCLHHEALFILWESHLYDIVPLEYLLFMVAPHTVYKAKIDHFVFFLSCTSNTTTHLINKWLSMALTKLCTFLSLSPETVSMYCSWIMKAARLAV